MKIDLSIDSLLTEAIEKTGLSDFGSQSFHKGLSILIDSCKRESNLHEFGHNFFREHILLRLLVNRLKIQDWLRRHPEILKEKIEKPLFIVGLPRSGTTFLHTLLSLDPNRRVLLNWEATDPCPPPELVHCVNDPRIQSYNAAVQLFEQTVPGIQAIYPINAGDVAECTSLMSHEFKSVEFHTWLWVPSYSEWWFNCDMQSAYAYHKQLLQLLQWRSPNDSWVLKTPMHLLCLDVLLNQYPDAQFVFIHRDTPKVLASLASLYSTWNSMFSDKIDKRKVADWTFRMLALSIEKTITVRNDWKPEMYYDMQYRDFVEDPVLSVKRIYEHFGYDVKQNHERRMRVWMRDNPNGKRGKHHYSYEKFSIDPLEVRKYFVAYQEQFEITLEI